MQQRRRHGGGTSPADRRTDPVRCPAHRWAGPAEARNGTPPREPPSASSRPSRGWRGRPREADCRGATVGLNLPRRAGPGTPGAGFVRRYGAGAPYRSRCADRARIGCAAAAAAGAGRYGGIVGGCPVAAGGGQEVLSGRLGRTSESPALQRQHAEANSDRHPKKHARIHCRSSHCVCA